MADMNSGMKIIAVSDGAIREIYLLKQILIYSKREAFTIIPAGEVREQKVAVLLAAQPVGFLNPENFSVCVAEYSLVQRHDFSGFRNLITFSTERDGADFTARNIRSLPGGITAFEIVGVGIIGRVRLKTDTADDAAVSLAAAAAAIAAGIPFAEVLEALNAIDHFDR